MIRGILQKTFIGFTTLAAGLALFGTQAQADCRLTITPAYSTWALNYDPFTGGDPVDEFNFEYENKGLTACVGRLTVVGDRDFRHLTSRTGATPILYQLRNLSGSENLTPGESGNLTGLTIEIPANGKTTGRMRFSASPSDNVAAGDYTQNVRLRFVATGGTVAETNVELLLHVKSSLVIGLAGEFRRVNGTATLDLGQLTQNGIVQLNAKIYVRASSGYQVTVTSQNGGYLRHDQPEWQIPYGLSVGGQVINLSGPRVLNNNGTIARTDDYPLQISVSDIQAKRAGKYSDVLNFTVTAI